MDIGRRCSCLAIKNEGFPLVSLEAQRCGVQVVGTAVGGIPEAIGQENSVLLNDDFIENFAFKIIDCLINKKEVTLSDEFSLTNAVKKELDVYKSIIG